MTKSDLEQAFLTYWIQLGDGSELIEEYQFHPTRRWKFDFALPDKKIAIEIEGIGGSKSRHTSIKGYTADCDKYNNATVRGWRVLRFTTLHFKDPHAMIATVTQANELFQLDDIASDNLSKLKASEVIKGDGDDR